MPFLCGGDFGDKSRGRISFILNEFDSRKKHIFWSQWLRKLLYEISILRES